MELDPLRKRRYSRHLILEGFGAAGQERLLGSKVLIVGVGGLGSPAALYLAAAGTGTIGLVDADTVSLSNLQRQIIHSTADVNHPKVNSAAERIEALNPDVKVVRHPFNLTADNAPDLIGGYDYVVDGTDNFASKYLINDACVMLGKPFSIGGINRYRGQLMTHVPGSACYRCLFPEPPDARDVETCSMTGVLGSIAGICGTLLATECLKYIIGHGELLTDALLTFDAASMQFRRLAMARNAKCLLCGTNPSITELREYSFKPCQNK